MIQGKHDPRKTLSKKNMIQVKHDSKKHNLRKNFPKKAKFTRNAVLEKPLGFHIQENVQIKIYFLEVKFDVCVFISAEECLRFQINLSHRRNHRL